ncbi:DUF3558 domain-containing protein [Streptomyces phaeochromogenes]|uniref:DUF3558 domain-containing protein n=1 Tax=Streptomyces phaeochromogenes TaxID=1923 RepID=UPI0022510700|nr:DUF3558 domain-containing protein [Streptomyces phaeochromogenes]MCX5604534.1 DUF3558 domain-containing protein [Streptomyces phaeochromogenes]WRZ31508.1 DUF3558 domain-containing protein [Streptomyces phaeochromogenes]WSJ06127.1 DUF3558 domain-containing protein [Streptomyces phaeochromogenes]
MQRKAYVPGVAALLAVLLAGCTGGSGNDDGTTDPKPGESATTPTAAQPGKYRTLPEPCAAVSHGTLDSLLPGIKQVTDEEQREKAYEGTATQTYDTDRKVGCRWKAQSTGATDHLLVDFERVVSYDNAVSDDDRATDIYLKRETAADLPEPVASSESSDASESPESSSSSGSSPNPSGSPSGDSGSGPSSSSSGAESDDESGSATPSDGSTPSALQPRTLDDLGDEAFLDDALSSSRQRTVTVVFRTSNVVVTIQYDEQPATTTDVPSSKDMQDRARKLAGQLAGTFDD